MVVNDKSRSSAESGGCCRDLFCVCVRMCVHKEEGRGGGGGGASPNFLLFCFVCYFLVLNILIIIYIVKSTLLKLHTQYQGQVPESERALR